MTTVEVTDDEEEAEAAAATPPPTAGLPACVQPAALEGLSLEDLAEVFSIESWERRLTEEDRAQLRTMLPRAHGDKCTDEEALTELFGREPQFFGDHLGRFWTALSAGDFDAPSTDAQDAADFEQETREHHNWMVHRLHYLKRTWTCPPPKMPPAPKGGASSSSDAPAKPARAGRPPLGRELAPSRAGAKGKRGHPSSANPAYAGFDGAGGSSNGDGGATAYAAPPYGGVVRGDGADADADGDVEMGEAEGEGDGGRFSPESASSLPVGPAGGAPTSGNGAGNGGGQRVELPSDFPPNLRFFGLVRDAIASVGQALAPAPYVLKQVAVQAQAAGMAARLPNGTVLAQYVKSVVQYLVTPALPHASRVRLGLTTGPPPAPALAFDDTTQSYRWLAPPELSTDQALLRMEVEHHELFCSQHGGSFGARGNSGYAVAGGGKRTPITLPPGSEAQLAAFRAEEAARYADGDSPYVYTRRDGTRSAVAPIGKGGGGKARDHFLLAPGRPSNVTLLTLVRDAAARMIGGEGSRSDVCELLCESAFVNLGVSDAQLSTVVSGTLDRLHYEQDSPVRFDTERKVWLYLHAKRAPQDFEAAASKAAAAVSGAEIAKRAAAAMAMACD